MSDESEIVTTAAAITPQDTLPLSKAGFIVWLQRSLLGMLIVGHVAIPFLFGVATDVNLLGDATMIAQVSLLLIALTLGGLRWRGVSLLLLGSAVPALGWYLTFPDYLREYVITMLITPVVVLAGSLMILRLRGWRGVWTDESTAPTRPWQVSILHLLIVTTLVAITLASASWLRESDWIGWENATARYWLIVSVDGVGIAVLSLFAIWAMGTRGSGGLKFLILCGVTAFLAGCQIYAFQMEDYWHLPAITSLCWVIVTGGSLFIWRVCGWQVIGKQNVLI